MKNFFAFIFLFFSVFPAFAEGDPPSLPTKTKIGSVKTVRHIPTRRDILKESKPAKLSPVDSLIFKREAIRIGSSRTFFLINRIKDEVEYVWSPTLRRFVRPHFVMLNAQRTYERYRDK